MEKKVYIKKFVHTTIGYKYEAEIDKNIDGIGKLCISAIGELYKALPDVKKDVPVFFGSGYSSIHSLNSFNVVCEKSGALYVNPSLFPNTVLNSPFCRASIYHGIKSPIYNISNGRFSGLEALELAYMHIKNGETDNAIVCAAEEDCEFIQHIEKREISSSCTAIYLSGQLGEIEIQNFSRKKKKFLIENDYMEEANIYNIFKNIIDTKLEKELILENIQGNETMIKIKIHKE